ncbi:MAG TPA: MotA/TolQ/ExbB proton channel family protein [Sandaracinaceae bacterium LLY-WYZ-13_1]|nr:MotA/TolQ/ExbB proton channel family protein [Sandaracinaceae bacterium LLY-WYZ-13_1]
MDIATLIGIVLGFGLITGSILMGGSITSFIDVPSLLIVVGGTVASTLIMERLERVLGAFKVAMNAVRGGKAASASDTIKRIVELSAIARREGVLALENEQIEDGFLEKGVRMAVDGMPEEEIVHTMQAELMSMKERHQRGQKLFKFMSSTAPSMGMIGTLIGLVQMLQSLDDPSSIGPAMAVALLTTMYGAVLAFLVCGPIAEKLGLRSKEETARMVVIIEGIQSIVRGQNATIIQEKLEARLAPTEREDDKQAA